MRFKEPIFVEHIPGVYSSSWKPIPRSPVRQIILVSALGSWSAYIDGAAVGVSYTSRDSAIESVKDAVRRELEVELELSRLKKSEKASERIKIAGQVVSLVGAVFVVSLFFIYGLGWLGELSVHSDRSTVASLYTTRDSFRDSKGENRGAEKESADTTFGRFSSRRGDFFSVPKSTSQSLPHSADHFSQGIKKFKAASKSLLQESGGGEVETQSTTSPAPVLEGGVRPVSGTFHLDREGSSGSVQTSQFPSVALQGLSPDLGQASESASKAGSIDSQTVRSHRTSSKKRFRVSRKKRKKVYRSSRKKYSKIYRSSRKKSRKTDTKVRRQSNISSRQTRKYKRRRSRFDISKRKKISKKRISKRRAVVKKRIGRRLVRARQNRSSARRLVRRRLKRLRSFRGFPF